MATEFDNKKSSAESEDQFEHRNVSTKRAINTSHKRSMEPAYKHSLIADGSNTMMKSDESELNKIEIEAKTETHSDDPEIVQLLKSSEIQNTIKLKKGSGAQISRKVLAEMGERFTSLDDIIIHTDQSAIELCEMLNARAFAFGNEIYFNAGEYNTSTQEGKDLLRHELSHIIQQQEDNDEKIQRQVKKEKIQAVKSEDFLPTEPSFLGNLNKMTFVWRKALLLSYKDTVNRKWIEFKTTTMPAKIGNLKADEKEYKKDIKSSEKGVRSGIKGVAKSEPENYTSYLNLNVSKSKSSSLISKADQEIKFDDESTRLAIDLIEGRTEIDKVAKDPVDTFVTMMNLRRLDDVLTRLLVVYNVSKMHSLPLNEVMALYRAEGNMGIPNSSGSIDLGIPSGRKGAIAKTYLALPPGADISNMIILYPANVFEDDVPLTDAKRKSYIINRAVRAWFLQIAGLDQVGAIGTVEQLKDVDLMKKRFAEWSVENWKKAGKDSPTAKEDAAKRWEDLFNNMEYKELTSSKSEKAISVLPKDPKLLISTILVEGMMLLQRFKKASEYGPLSHGVLKDPNKKMPAEMAYLNYNMQTKADDYKRNIIMSALIASSKSNNPTYNNLKERITKFSALKILLRAGTPKLSEWSNVLSWINDKADNLDLLVTFITSAGTTDWVSYGGLSKKGSSGGSGAQTGGHRGALSRFMLLNEFYKMLGK